MAIRWRQGTSFCRILAFAHHPGLHSMHLSGFLRVLFYMYPKEKGLDSSARARAPDGRASSTAALFFFCALLCCICHERRIWPILWSQVVAAPVGGFFVSPDLMVIFFNRRSFSSPPAVGWHLFLPTACKRPARARWRKVYHRAAYCPIFCVFVH